MRSKIVDKIRTEIVVVLAKLVANTGLTLLKLRTLWIREEAASLNPENTALICVFLNCVGAGVVGARVNMYCTLNSVEDCERALKERSKLLHELVDGESLYYK
jgi:hypothetical protein